MNTLRFGLSDKRNLLALTLMVVAAGVLTWYVSPLSAQTDPDGTAVNQVVNEEEVLQLNLQIQERKQTLERLNEQKEEYARSLSAKQRETLTLSSQLETLEQQIQKTELEIEIAETEIDTLRLQIREVENKIGDREKEITLHKEQLGIFIRQLNRYKSTNTLTLLLRNERFSDFFTDVNYVEELEHRLKSATDNVMELKQELESVQTDLQKKHSDIESKQQQLESQQQELSGQAEYKADLLDETKLSEERYQSLLSAVKTEQDSVNNELGQIEDTLRSKLEGSGEALDNSTVLSWPVDPGRGITAYFHDPAYIFRRLFEHPAIDVRAKQGTPIRAAASGYVGRVRDPKDVGLGYAYIMLIHADGISTVYGHMSQVNVSEEEYVTRGQIIGLSGAMPGTPGAGRLTTGPHLHFEVRKDGIPVNPLEYLP